MFFITPVPQVLPPPCCRWALRLEEGQGTEMLFKT